MSETLSLKGTLEIGAGACVSSCSDVSRNTIGLSLRCASGQTFQSAVQTPAPIMINTAGAVGSAWQDLDVLGDLTAIEFLYAKSKAGLMLRIGAAAASLVGSGGLFPTTFVGGETLDLVIDGTAVSVAFLVGDQTAAQCVARINAACALAGLPTPRASVRSDGQIQIDGVLTGADHAVEVTGGTGAVRLGFAGTPSAVGAGSDVPLYGTFIAEFGTKGTTPAPPTRIQASGVGELTLVAAGSTT